MANRSRLEIIKSGSALDVSDEINYVWESHDGFGMAPLQRHSESGPQQHGDSDRGYNLEPRFVNLVIAAMGNNWDDVYQNIDRLLRYLHPGSPSTLRFTRPEGAARQLEVFAVKGPLYGASDIIGFFGVKVGMTLKAPDPAWYDPAGKDLTFNLGGGGDTTTVPTNVPTGVGASTIDQSIAVNYPGTWIAFPVIRVIGPITNPIITNQSTGHKLDFTGTTIASNDWFDIELRFGNKVIRDSTGVYQNGSLSDPNDLALFGIYPDPEAPNGINSIRVQGSGINQNSRIELSWLDKYL